MGDWFQHSKWRRGGQEVVVGGVGVFGVELFSLCCSLLPQTIRFPRASHARLVAGSLGFGVGGWASRLLPGQANGQLVLPVLPAVVLLGWGLAQEELV